MIDDVWISDDVKLALFIEICARADRMMGE